MASRPARAVKQVVMGIGWPARFFACHRVRANKVDAVWQIFLGPAHDVGLRAAYVNDDRAGLNHFAELLQNQPCTP